MENTLSWNNVVNIKEKPVTFVACHEFMAWREHTAFENLENAITKGPNCSRLLLQSLKGNANHRNYQHRGPASHVVLWYADEPWAILMNKEEVTLVPKSGIQAIHNGNPTSATAVCAKLEQLFEASPAELRRPLDKNFYKHTIARNG